jgi:hypothetical protein
MSHNRINFTLDDIENLAVKIDELILDFWANTDMTEDVTRELMRHFGLREYFDKLDLDGALD